jgi:hypothetical protein
VVYATGIDFVDGRPTVELREELRDALRQADRAATALAPGTVA